MRRARARVEDEHLGVRDPDFSPSHCNYVCGEQVRAQCGVRNGRDQNLHITAGRDVDYPFQVRLHQGPDTLPCSRTLLQR